MSDDIPAVELSNRMGMLPTGEDLQATDHQARTVIHHLADASDVARTILGNAFEIATLFGPTVGALWGKLSDELTKLGWNGVAASLTSALVFAAAQRLVEPTLKTFLRNSVGLLKVQDEKTAVAMVDAILGTLTAGPLIGGLLGWVGETKDPEDPAIYGWKTLSVFAGFFVSTCFVDLIMFAWNTKRFQIETQHSMTLHDLWREWGADFYRGIGTVEGLVVGVVGDVIPFALYPFYFAAMQREWNAKHPEEADSWKVVLLSLIAFVGSYRAVKLGLGLIVARWRRYQAGQEARAE